ncbi:MAG: hypothetical protein GY789_23860 [Hyphomicrobiales bacterium]|nr:hypothetical protein [Hyphomicrobiales bacterium]MCP4999975.1 hypothetical protein [Hyphomicrobiales bacterium]
MKRHSRELNLWQLVLSVALMAAVIGVIFKSTGILPLLTLVFLPAL